jgi:UDP-N-acetylglucosamine 4,6-dehydratase
MNWKRETVLVTGGTGTFGRAFVETVLRDCKPRKVIVFSRDEHKQNDMRKAGLGSPRVEYLVGDVRDARSLRDAMHGVTVVVHAAALKQVPLCEAQPSEAISTNVLGAQHIVEAALTAGVGRVAALSTDKAVHPVNVYGATKLLAERLFLRANAEGRNRRCRFSCVRYGNVIGSRGSLLPMLLEQRRTGRVTITDRRMTRFWMTIEDAVGFVLCCLDSMRGGEVFVPKVRGARIVDLIKAVAPGCAIESIGRRPGEKIHEVLISEDEAPYALERAEGFVIYPWVRPEGGRRFRGARYASDTVERLSLDELRGLGQGQDDGQSPIQSQPAARLARR